VIAGLFEKPAGQPQRAFALRWAMVSPLTQSAFEYSFLSSTEGMD
jgi:hypothetical protein